jgi:hypothetical protein
MVVCIQNSVMQLAAIFWLLVVLIKKMGMLQTIGFENNQPINPSAGDMFEQSFRLYAEAMWLIPSTKHGSKDKH